ncbi:SRPBCC domain-containing protein [Caulobacter segnis]|uniref:SRPBCC domain-containing protein n=1 Tax=Caulobacter segnis TaxID=88688 RepID=UPI001CC0BE7C|nr:SRPBCC domain-containing protein [Caulobacter segnis]UAL12276.1 SRPBCC domain-containing protein [Caulobacter segnis]
MSSRILVAVRIAAPPEVVFDAFTTDIALWWKPSSLFSFTPRSPGGMAFEDGRLVERLPTGKVFEVGKVRIWERGARLVFGWRQAAFAPGMDTEVEVRFEAVEAGTRVTVEHRGWDSVPAPHVARHGFPDAVFLQRHGEWWRALLAGLASRANSVQLGAAGEGEP